MSILTNLAGALSLLLLLYLLYAMLYPEKLS